MSGQGKTSNAAKITIFADSFRGLNKAEIVHGSICWQQRKVTSSAEMLVQ